MNKKTLKIKDIRIVDYNVEWPTEAGCHNLGCIIAFCDVEIDGDSYDDLHYQCTTTYDYESSTELEHYDYEREYSDETESQKHKAAANLALAAVQKKFDEYLDKTYELDQPRNCMDGSSQQIVAVK